MTESAIADFVARFVADSTVQDEPIRGRVLLSEKRLVLATGDDKHAIPLSSVFDVTVGHVPPNVSEFFDDTVTVAYTKNDRKRTAVIEGDEEVISRFSTVLFKAELNGAQATVRHPARIGGRVIDSPAEIGSVRIGDGSVRFAGLSNPLEIELASVIDFEKSQRTINDRRQLSLLVRHMSETQSVTSEITLPSQRKMNILGRYLRLEYSSLMAEIRDLDVSDAEMELLVALYSSSDADGGGPDLARLLGVDASRVAMLMNELEEKGLVVRSSETTSLTSMGRMMIGSRMEEINI